jgi:transposase
LTIAKAPGTVPLVSPAIRQALRDRLAQPDGFASYKAIWQWLHREHGLALAYQTVHKLVRYTLRAKLKVPRKSHLKNPVAGAAFQESFPHIPHHTLTDVQAVPQPSSEHPERVFCQAESRLGLLPVQRGHMTVSSVKPIDPVPYQVEHFYVYAAVEPITGESFFLELPQLNGANFQIFLNEFAHDSSDTLNLVLMDDGSCHTAKSLVIPANVVCLFLPPYSPELNPMERLWQAMKAQLAWMIVAPIAALEHQVETLIRQYSKAAVRSLTSYPYFLRAVNAVCS